MEKVRDRRFFLDLKKSKKSGVKGEVRWNNNIVIN